MIALIKDGAIEHFMPGVIGLSFASIYVAHMCKLSDFFRPWPHAVLRKLQGGINENISKQLNDFISIEIVLICRVKVIIYNQVRIKI